MTPLIPTPERFRMGDNKRFQFRQLNQKGQELYQVYSIGLDHWCTCDTPEHAETIKNALEKLYDEQTSGI